MKGLKDMQKWVAEIEREMLSGPPSTAPSVSSARSTPSQVRSNSQLRRFLEKDSELSIPFYPLTQRSATPRRDVYDRLYQEGQASARKKEQARQTHHQAAEALDKSFSHSPKINTVQSTSALPCSERLYYMDVHYKRHKEELREARLEHELKEVRDPEICSRSVLLTERLVLVIQPRPVEDRLLAAGYQREKNVQDRGLDLMLESRARASPRISPMAAQLQRSGNISDRLYRFAAIYAEKKEESAERWRPPEPVSSCRKGSSPSRLLEPIKHVKELPRDFPFSPAISSRSREMAERQGSPESRLLQPQSRPKLEFSEDSQPFRPALNTKTEELALNRESPGRRWEVLYKEREAIEQRKQVLIERVARWEEDHDECSFHPLISPSALNPASPVYDRLTVKSQERNQRLHDMRLKEIQNEVDGCSFSPEVHRYKGAPNVDITKRKGVERHFERVARANADKQEKEKLRDRFNGDGWTNTPTRPKSPRLGPRTPTSLKRIVRHLDFH